MENYEDIDIKRIFNIIFSKKILIILIITLSITLGYVYSYYYKQPEYKSSVTILLVADENKANKELTQTDLSINTSLISTYSSIAKSTNVMQKTIDNLGLDISTSKLQKNIEVNQIEKTQFLKVTVRNSNPEIAKNIANELSRVFTEQIKEIYNLANISIVDEAEIENVPCNINHLKDIIIFTFAGLLISIMTVMIIYFFDDTIKDEKDIEKNIKLRNIGTLPIDKENNDLIIENNPKSHIVECIKTIRTNILYATNRKTILITSSKQKEGKSWIINNLAIAFAQANKKVILVDTDLRKENEKNKIFGIEKGEGLSDFIKEISDNKLENLENSRKYIKETKIPNLHILQNGTIPPNPSELISSNNMKKLLDLLKNMYDIILLDGTPCMIVSDSIALSSMVDSTILVAENKKTKISDLKKTKRLIEDVNGKILGVISNKSEIQKGKYYGKRYGYYYGKELEEIKEIEEIEEKQNVVSLEEVIKLAKENIKEELVNENEKVKEEDNNLHEEKPDAIYEIKRDDTKKQINNITNTIDSLKKIQNNNNRQLLDKIENINNVLEDSKEEYSNTLEEINNKIINNDEKIEQLIEQFVSEINKLKEEIKTLKEDQENNNSKLLEKIEEANYEEKISEINKKLESMNYDEKLTEINNKIESMNYEQKIAEINERIQEKQVKSSGNIISFESLKEKRKTNKKVFKINESITYEDLERLSTCTIDFNENVVNAEAISN